MSLWLDARHMSGKGGGVSMGSPVGGGVTRDHGNGLHNLDPGTRPKLMRQSLLLLAFTNGLIAILRYSSPPGTHASHK